MIVTGGTVRLVSYTPNSDGTIEIRNFSAGDSILGISLIFEAHAYEDERKYTYDNKRSHGPNDSIVSMRAFFTSADTLEITEKLSNDTSLNLITLHENYDRFVQSRSVHKIGQGEEKDIYTCLIYENFNDFIRQYNDRSMFPPYGVGCFEAEQMKEELFFWIDDENIINLAQQQGAISIIVNFGHRVILLRGER
ncbi:MAG: hypothetical protein IPM77_11770 [Crocinitomicaceae bacterium]|nr:hypothetical protein [Crocinitomicaceae bacterium]